MRKYVAIYSTIIVVIVIALVCMWAINTNRLDRRIAEFYRKYSGGGVESVASDEPIEDNIKYITAYDTNSKEVLVEVSWDIVTLLKDLDGLQLLGSDLHYFEERLISQPIFIAIRKKDNELFKVIGVLPNKADINEYTISKDDLISDELSLITEKGKSLSYNSMYYNYPHTDLYTIGIINDEFDGIVGMYADAR